MARCPQAERLTQPRLIRAEYRARRTEDGIDILPADVFVRRLWDGDLA